MLDPPNLKQTISEGSFR